VKDTQSWSPGKQEIQSEIGDYRLENS